MTEIKPIVVYTADCIGNAANCQYPNEVKITDESLRKAGFFHGYGLRPVQKQLPQHREF